MSVPPLGPDPTLLSRKEVDALYDTLAMVTRALRELKVPYIVTGGSLLGAIRQHSILFCDDDVDIAIVGQVPYEHIVKPHLQETLDRIVRQHNSSNDIPSSSSSSKSSSSSSSSLYQYQIRPWQGGDRVRPRHANSIFIDIFCLREYATEQDWRQVMGIKANGQVQPHEYIQKIQTIMTQAVQSSSSLTHDDEDHDKTSNTITTTSTTKQIPLFPCWHFTTRKAMELWPKEVYKAHELFPLQQSLEMGPVHGITGPHLPVVLLQRAFGTDCFRVYYPSVVSHKETTTTTSKQKNNGEQNNNNNKNNTTQTPPALPPHTSRAGQWQDGQPRPLEPQHYIPLQPTARAKRKCGTKPHNQHVLLHEYLPQQIRYEQAVMEEHYVSTATTTTQSMTNHTTDTPRPRQTIYMDGVFDLFHIGHVEALRQCAVLGDRVIIGVSGDVDAAGYKRPPTMSQEERVALIQACRYVDHVVCPCPLIVTREFMEAHDIDLVVHGFASPQDAARQHEFFAIPMELGKFREIPYYAGQSTTAIMDQIVVDYMNTVHSVEAVEIQSEEPTDSDEKKTQSTSQPNPKWFGDCLAHATNFARKIDYDPFPVALRMELEPHFAKARERRRQGLERIRQRVGATDFDATMQEFSASALAKEGRLRYDVNDHHKLLTALLESMGLCEDSGKYMDLSTLHKWETSKDMLLYELTQRHALFQEAFDHFVRTICVPHMASLLPNMDQHGFKIYYQSFPCIRIVSPGDFSIGPHADVAYGHHPCSINYYIPLTPIADTYSLFLESREGSEDWHPLISAEGRGELFHFPGAQNLHWTPTNTSDQTRVSLDVRLIPGNMYHAFQDETGSFHNTYQSDPGYYSSCCLHEDGLWHREGPLLSPDARVGFPWTVKDWSKVLSSESNGTNATNTNQ